MSLFRPSWWTREGDDEDPDHLASTGTPIRRPPDHEPHPRRLAVQPTWVKIVVAVVIVVGTVRLLGSVGAWEECGADGGQAWMLAIQGLGARPSALECLGVGMNQPAGSTPSDGGGHPGQGATTRAECEAERRAAGADLSACAGLP